MISVGVASSGDTMYTADSVGGVRVWGREGGGEDVSV